MKEIYPIVLTKDEGCFLVDVPDFVISTFGRSLVEAVEMGRDAIASAGLDREDHGEGLPRASGLCEVRAAHPDGIVTLVDVDFGAYRRRMETRAVKKTLSLPSWLNEAAEKAGVNFSAVLQDGLKDVLNLR